MVLTLHAYILQIDGRKYGRTDGRIYRHMENVGSTLIVNRFLSFDFFFHPFKKGLLL